MGSESFTRSTGSAFRGVRDLESRARHCRPFQEVSVLESRATQRAAASTSLTHAGGSIGTPAYTAPEQAVGAEVDHGADIYAWSVAAYELLADAHPFAGKANCSPMNAAHQAETPVPLTQRNADVPAALDALVQRCLAKDATHRPAGADEVLQSLESVATPSGVTRASAWSAVAGTNGGRRSARHGRKCLRA